MKWFLYNIGFALVYLLMTPHWLLRMLRRGGYGPGFMQRFGIYGRSLRAHLAEYPRVWVHAVSVGEVHVAGRLMQVWRERDPGIAFVVTVNTSTGLCEAQRYLAKADVVVYFPCDFPWTVDRTIAALNPRMLVLVEGEYWPNLLRRLARARVPVAVVNARLSQSSYRGYWRIRNLFREAVSGISLVLAQSEVDAERLGGLGVPPKALRTMGAAKFDIPEPDEGATAQAAGILDATGFDREGRMILVGGSTWAGEERALVDACLPHAGKVLLVLVPRHMERRDDVVADLMRVAGLDLVQRSVMGQGGERSQAHGSGMPVLLLDSTGELAAMYALADLVFVGKSLPPHCGGQNMIEPASFGAPLVVGPHTENFPGVMEIFREAEAIKEVANAQELAPVMSELICDRERASALGERAQAVVRAQRGVTDRTLDLLQPLLLPGAGA